MIRKLFLSLPLLLSATAAQAQDAHARALAPFLDERTVAVLHIDLGAIDLDRITPRIAAALDVPAARLNEPKKRFGEILNGLKKAGATHLYLVMSLADVPDYSAFAVVPLAKGTDAKALAAALEKSWLSNEHFSFEKVGNAVVGSEHRATRDRLRKLKPTPRPDLLKALAATRGFARLVVVPTLDTARILEETMPTLPDELGGGSIKPLSRGLRWVALRVALPAKGAKTPAVRVVVQAANARQAKELNALIGRVGKAVTKLKEVREEAPGVDKVVKLLSFQVKDDRLTLDLDDKVVAPLLKPFVARALEVEELSRIGGQLRKLALAMHEYHDESGRLPAPASYDKGGKALLSWRVHLLPHLGQAALYKEFKLDEPWDSPHNKKLLARMPAAYRPASAKLAAEFKTTCLTPVGEETVFPGKTGVRIVDITDGTSSTILLLDAADDHAVPWTKPGDLKVDKKDPLKGLGFRHGGRALVAFADAEVRFVSAKVAPMTLWAMFTRSGGEVVEME
jgi:hypothetical protein